MSIDAGLPREHPSPHRGRVSTVALLFGLAAGPAAWVGQLLVGYGLSSYACYPSSVPQQSSPPPGWAAEHAILIAVNLACLALALVGLAVAVACWRRAQGEKAGGGETLLEIGEGRARFLAGCGILTATGFAIAILFDAAVIVGVPACWSIGQ